MASTERLVIALLAAGSSRRFGNEDKLLAPLGGKPLLHWAADAARAVDAADHLVITSAAFPPSALPGGYRQRINTAPDEGLAASLRIAAAHAQTSGATALMVLLGDMPMVTTAHLLALRAARDAGEARAIFSRPAKGPPRPPALFTAAHLPVLEAGEGDAGARSLMQGGAFVDADAALLLDVDTPDDLLRCSACLAAR